MDEMSVREVLGVKTSVHTVRAVELHSQVQLIIDVTQADLSLSEARKLARSILRLCNRIQLRFDTGVSK